MKRAFLTIAIGAVATGCAPQRHAALAPVGPAPGISVKAPANTGNLVVYSAWRRTGTDDPDHRIHSNYDLLTEDRSQLLTVRNYVTPMLEDPAIVALSPGQYVVKARVQRYGLMEIPVVIESRKLTALFMDDSTVPDVTPNQAERIQLPDGRVIGWASVAK